MPTGIVPGLLSPEGSWVLLACWPELARDLVIRIGLSGDSWQRGKNRFIQLIQPVYLGEPAYPQPSVSRRCSHPFTGRSGVVGGKERPARRAPVFNEGKGRGRFYRVSLP